MKLTLLLSTLGTAAFLLSASLPAMAAVTTFTDSSPGTSWISTKVTDTTAGSAATFSIVNQGSGGNTGAYRQVTHTFGFGGLGVAHLPDTTTTTAQQFCWYPISQGEVLTIDYCYDLVHTTGNGSSAVAYTMMIQQGGNYYRPAQDAIFNTTWTSYSRFGLTANDFSRVQPNSLLLDTTQHPDFSAGAPTLILGYWSGNSHTSFGATATTISGMDNFRINLHHAVPEPSAALLGVGAAGLMLVRRRRL